jgi:hypothetical protein
MRCVSPFALRHAALGYDGEAEKQMKESAEI